MYDSPVRILLLVSAAFRSHKARHNSRTNQNWNSTFSFGHFGHMNLSLLILIETTIHNKLERTIVKIIVRVK